MVCGNFRLTPEDNKFPIIWAPGAVKRIYFSLDNSLADDTHGVKDAPQQALRVAVMDVNGHVQHTHDFLVGRGPSDSGTKAIYLDVNTPSSACAAFISPGSKGPCDQRIAFVCV